MCRPPARLMSRAAGAIMIAPEQPITASGFWPRAGIPPAP